MGWGGKRCTTVKRVGSRSSPFIKRSLHRGWGEGMLRARSMGGDRIKSHGGNVTAALG